MGFRVVIGDENEICINHSCLREDIGDEGDIQLKALYQITQNQTLSFGWKS